MNSGRRRYFALNKLKDKIGPLGIGQTLELFQLKQIGTAERQGKTHVDLFERFPRWVPRTQKFWPHLLRANSYQERERFRERERQTDRHTERERERDRQTERERETV